MFKKLSKIFEKNNKDDLANFKNSIDNIFNYYFTKYSVKEDLDKYILEYSIDRGKTIEKLDAKKFEFVSEMLNSVQVSLKNYSSITLKIEFINSIIKGTQKQIKDLSYLISKSLYNLSLYNEINNRIIECKDKIEGLTTELIDKKEITDSEKKILLDNINLENKKIKEVILLINIRDLTNYLFEFERDKYQLFIDKLNQLKNNIKTNSKQLATFFENEDIKKIIDYFNIRFRGIPYDHFKNVSEAIYNSNINIILAENQIDFVDQKHNNTGRSDIIIERKSIIYCFELKLDKTAEEALKQIIEKDYLGEYRLKNKKIVAVGINISSNKRQIDDYKIK